MKNLQLITVISFISYIIPLCCYANSVEFRNCSLLYNCGSLRGIGYPFWGGESGDRPSYCGRQGYGLFCVDGQYTTIWIDRVYYRVLGIDLSIPKMKIARNDLWRDICPHDLSFFKDTNLLNSHLNDPARKVRTLRIFYGCTSEVIAKVQIKSNVTCSINGVSGGVVFTDSFVSAAEGCTMSFVALIQSAAYYDLWDGKITLQEALNQGFEVQFNVDQAACSSCEASGGKCGSDSTSQFICICQDKSHPTICTNHGKERSGTAGKERSVKMTIGAIFTAIGILSCIIICYCCYKKCSTECSLFILTRKTKDDKELEVFIKENDSLKPRRYSYSDVKKMTNYFKEKLGQGGYGEVYRGNLADKRPVAVKFLNSTKGNGEEFINEVASVSKTSHVNVVTLVGFCLDGAKRALIYEFMPNGSLDKYIHPDSDVQLGLERLYEIAIGTARGLEYLHGGCNTRILHFDIKPHNILLDEDFCPKISDFGLAKLCARKESIVSMLGARGTIGYIAPEVFSRNFGKVSYKSDVYSYGMMVLEMVGGRKNAANTQLSNASETYFPDWFYDYIMIQEDLKLHDHAMTKEENEIARKMILVGLWCIQTDPLHRPTMSKVIDMLESNSQSLEVPPKPFLSSAPRSEAVTLEISVLPPKNMSSFSGSEGYSYSYTTSK